MSHGIDQHTGMLTFKSRVTSIEKSIEKIRIIPGKFEDCRQRLLQIYTESVGNSKKTRIVTSHSSTYTLVDIILNKRFFLYIKPTQEVPV